MRDIKNPSRNDNNNNDNNNNNNNAGGNLLPPCHGGDGNLFPPGHGLGPGPRPNLGFPPPPLGINEFIQPVIGSPFKSLITYAYGTVFLILLTTKTSSDQFGVYSLAKMFLYFDILTRSPALNLGSF